MQVLTATANEMSFSRAASIDDASAPAAQEECRLLRGIGFGILLQATAAGILAGSWMLIRHL